MVLFEKAKSDFNKPENLILPKKTNSWSPYIALGYNYL